MMLSLTIVRVLLTLYGEVVDWCRVGCWLYTEVMVLLAVELLLLTVYGVDLVAGCIQR